MVTSLVPWKRRLIRLEGRGESVVIRYLGTGVSSSPGRLVAPSLLSEAGESQLESELESE